MEPLQHGLELLERVVSDNVAACDVTELEECGNCFDHIGGDESLDSVQINLSNDTFVRYGSNLYYVHRPSSAPLNHRRSTG